MVRRLTVSLMLLACLLGIIQPALACVSQADCCHAGCGQPIHPGAGSVAISDCCATDAVSSSVSITTQPRHALGQTFGSLVITAGPAHFQSAVQPGVPPRLTELSCAVDPSPIYLRTARLRL